MAVELGGVSGGSIATSVLVIEAGASLYAAFCPSWFTVRSPFFHEQKAREGNVQAIRQGELVATLLTVATGAASSVLVQSPLPLIGAVVVAAVMIGGYEYSMGHPATDVGRDGGSEYVALNWGSAK